MKKRSIQGVALLKLIFRLLLLPLLLWCRFLLTLCRYPTSTTINMPAPNRWALLMAVIVVVALCAVAPTAADDDDDDNCWGCAAGSCVRLSQPARDGRKLLSDNTRELLQDDDNDDNNDNDSDDDNDDGSDDDNDDDDDSRRTCRRCRTGYALVNATDDDATVGRCGECCKSWLTAALQPAV
jgi:hypothetical protein